VKNWEQHIKKETVRGGFLKRRAKKKTKGRRELLPGKNAALLGKLLESGGRKRGPSPQSGL